MRAVAQVGLILLACSLFGSCQLPEEEAGKTTRDVNLTDAIEMFAAADLVFSYNRLEWFVLQPTLHEKAANKAVAYLNEASFERRFAAVYLLLRTHDGKYSDRLLAAHGEERDHRIKVILAGHLVGRGYKQVIPTLIDSLDSELLVPFALPAKPLWWPAYEALPHYTGKDFGLADARSKEAVAETKPLWQRWWADHATGLVWEEGRYVSN